MPLHKPTAALALPALALLALAGCHAAPQPPAANTPSDIATEYDLVYAMSHNRVSTAPSPFLVQTISALPHPGGTALDLAGGSGRNSVYLATHGYDVTDVDLSHIGLDLAQQAAASARVTIHTVAADLNQYDMGAGKWDLIVLIDFPFPYKPLLPRMAAALKPGGLVLIQAVALGQPGLDSPDKALHYTYMDPRDLAAPFSGFGVLHNSVSEEPTMWGVKALMLRYSARKP